MWRSGEELAAEVKDSDDLAGQARLYWLSKFWVNAVLPGEYKASDEWESILGLTGHGEAALRDLDSSLSALPTPDVLLALFCKFFHHELFFDPQATDWTKIRQVLERELLEERIRLPYRFGRLLYDRFNDTYGHARTDHLMSDDVQGLLKGTPVGVFQLGSFVSGPLGIIDSKEARHLPPSLSLPLWHCSDTGCRTVHNVRLIPPSVPVVDALERINKTLSGSLGPPSEWDHLLTRVQRRLHPRSLRPYYDLPVVIADCIVELERRTLLQAALQAEYRDFLRSILASPPRRKHDADGAASEISCRLTPEAQLQLLLALSDSELIGLLDDVFLSKAVRIPIGESRGAFYGPPRLSTDSRTYLSALGVRSVRRAPIVNLTSAIWHAYQRVGQTNELEWRVRGDGARPPYDALVIFVRNRGPADSVRELILSSAEITRTVCENHQISLKYAVGTDNIAVDRVLWKLGFNPMQFDESIPRFRARLSEFNETILACTPIDNEDARERVRAAGVNVFVSVEDFLDRLISYNLWLLSSDHFVSTRFAYSPAQARRSVGQTLGSSLTSGPVEVSWNATGDNPLGTLLRYLRSATEWIQSLPEVDRNPLRRPDRDLPHFAFDKDLPFPFRHTAFWADSDPAELRRHADLLARIVKPIEESELALVRNGLDHFREGERFPAADKLLACVARLGQALELADIHRFLPKVLWLFDRKETRFGSVEYEFRDYAGRTVFSYGPPLVSGLPGIRYENACLLAPGNLLGTPNSALIFQLREQSEYSDYWRGYPRRRRIPGAGGADVSSGGSDASPAAGEDTGPTR